MNFSKWANLICAATLMAACAHQETHSSPYFARDVVVIPAQDLYSYWRSSNPADGLTVLPASGCVSIEVTIDSNGKVYSPKVVAQSGPNDLNAGMLNYYTGQHFYPAPANPGRTPIKTTITVSYGEGRTAPDSKVSEPCAMEQGDLTKQKG